MNHHTPMEVWEPAAPEGRRHYAYIPTEEVSTELPLLRRLQEELAEAGWKTEYARTCSGYGIYIFGDSQKHLRAAREFLAQPSEEQR